MSTENQPSLFPKGEKISNDYFTGTVWLKSLVSETEFSSVIASVTFEPRARNNWHTHPGGQILIVTDGTGYYQEKGKAIQVIKKGDVVKIPADIVHWHGASPDGEFTHLAITTNAKQGPVIWLDKVTEEQYNSF